MAIADDGQPPQARDVPSTDTLYARATVARVPTGPEAAPPSVTSQRSRLINTDSTPTGSDTRPGNELAGVSYRWWSNHGRADLGVGIGTLGRVVVPAPGMTDTISALIGSTPTVTLGWRYRTSQSSSVFADASGARGLGIDNNNYVNTKLGAEWKTNKSRFGFDRGNLGVQLDSGYRMTLRLRKSGVGVYMRGQF